MKTACYLRQLDMQWVARELEAFGHEITSRWIHEEPFVGRSIISRPPLGRDASSGIWWTLPSPTA